MIVCKCPACSKVYKVRDELAGKSGKCACGNRFTIPAITESVHQPSSTQPPVVEPSVPPAPAAAPAPVPQTPQPEPPAPTQPAPPTIQPPRPLGIQPVVPLAPAPAPKAEDDAVGGVGRLTFTLALLFVVVIVAVLSRLARHSGIGMRMGALVVLVVSVVAMFIVTQARLLNIGSNEWLAAVWPFMVGNCVLFPENFGARARAVRKTNASTMRVLAVVVTVLFLVACLGYAYYLLRIA